MHKSEGRDLQVGKAQLERRDGGKGEADGPPSRKVTRRRRRSLKDLAVLIVDDDQPSAKLLSVVLSGEGCRIRVAPSAEEALAVLHSFQPQVIIIDLILPLMSGLLLAQRLKAEPATQDAVLIAVTAFNGPQAQRVALEAGFAAYVRKPIDPLSFARLVQAHVGEEK